MTVASVDTYHNLTFGSLFGAERNFAIAGLVIGMSLVATLFAANLDPRMFQGGNIWIKPIKFQISLAVYLLSLAFFARFLPKGMTDSLLYKIFSASVLIAIFAELMWIGGAAMYGTASHFNIASPIMAAIYSLMGVFAVLLTSASFVYGVAIWRNNNLMIDGSLRLSISISLILTFVLTVVTAGHMASQTGHLVGDPLTGAKVLLMGWSMEVGDLRVSHFFASHAMHIIPLVTFVGLRLGLLNQISAVAAVGTASLYTLFVGLTFFQALSGSPFISI